MNVYMYSQLSNYIDVLFFSHPFMLPHPHVHPAQVHPIFLILPFLAGQPPPIMKDEQKWQKQLS